MKTTRRDEEHQAALQTASLWERTFNSVPDLIAVLDRDHRILRVNQPMAAKLGRTPEDCIGRLCHKCVHGLDKPPLFCPHSRSLTDGKEHTAEVHEERLGGYFLVTTSPLRDDAGKVVGCVHVARDITQQKKDQEVLRHLLQGSDHERHLISCEIHDGLAQQLAGAIMQFQAYDSLKERNPAQAAKAQATGKQLIADAHAEARRLIEGLRPPQLEAGGILAAIAGMVEESNQRGKVKITFCHSVPRLHLTPMLENTIFRIVQECLANACHHSKSKKVKVELIQHGDQVRIEVRDWGVGFDVERVEQGHFGLEGIHERARVCGGRAVIKSSPHKGTDIIVELPLHSASAGA